MIIPAYNAEDFIDSTLNSVKSELVTGDEIIVIDDNSSDQTIRRTEQWRTTNPECNLKLLRTSRNGGPAAARNIGLSSASNSVIMWCDHDDLWISGHRDALMRGLQNNHACSGRFSFSLMSPTSRNNGSARTKWWRDEWLSGASYHGLDLGCSAMLKTCFEQVGFLDESLRFGGDDIEWFSRAIRQGVSHGVIDQTILERRIHERNLSADPRVEIDLLRTIRVRLRER